MIAFTLETIASSLSVNNGLSQGSWHDAEFCKNGHYAIGYRVGVTISKNINIDNAKASQTGNQRTDHLHSQCSKENNT